MATSRPELGSSLLVEQQLAPPCAEALVPLGQCFLDGQDAYPGSKGGQAQSLWPPPRREREPGAQALKGQRGAAP